MRIGDENTGEDITADWKKTAGCKDRRLLHDGHSQLTRIQRFLLPEEEMGIMRQECREVTPEGEPRVTGPGPSYAKFYAVFILLCASFLYVCSGLRYRP